MKSKTSSVARILGSSLAKTLAAIFVLFTLPLIARGDVTVYMNNGDSEFGTIDLNTGVFSEIGNMGQLLSGLGASGGNLYGGVFNGDELYEINTTTGAATPVGPGSISYYDTGSTATGLYALAQGAGGDLYLYSIDPLTGATVLIGPTGLAPVSTIGLSTASSVLYLDDDGTLYSLDTTTGTATAIGGTPKFGALTVADGTLYGGANNTGNPSGSQIYTVASNGNSNFVTDTSVGTGNFWGLAPTPEPATMLLFGTGLLALGWKFNARKRAS